ncbi:MAG: hypothetical protein ACJZ63_03030 [Candidatus Poseidoniaceae archaeon]
MDDAVLALRQWTPELGENGGLRSCYFAVETKGWQLFKDTLINS